MNVDFSKKQTISINGLKDKLYQMLYVNNKVFLYGTWYHGSCMYDLSTGKMLWEHKIKRKESYEGLMIYNPQAIGDDVICVHYDRSEEENPKDDKFIVRLNADTGEETWKADKPTEEEFLVYENKVYAYKGRSVICFDLDKQGKNTVWKTSLSFKAPDVFKECTASDAKGQPSDKYLKKKTMCNLKFCIWNNNLVVTTDVNKWAVIETGKGKVIREIDLTTAQVIKEVMTYPIGEIVISGDYAVFMHHGVFVRVNLAEGITEAITPTYKGKRKDAPDEPHTFWSYYDHGGFAYNGRFFTNNSTFNKEKKQEVYELPIDTPDGKIENVFQFPLPFKGEDVKQAGELLWAGYYEDSQKKYPGATFYSLEDGEHQIYLPEAENMVMNIAYSEKQIMILESKGKKPELHLVPYEPPIAKQPAIVLGESVASVPKLQESVTSEPNPQEDMFSDRYEYLNTGGEKIETYESSLINPEGEAPQDLKLKGSILLTKNDADRAYYYLGGNMVSVVGGIPAYMDVIDVSTGKVIWTIDQCMDVENMVTYDDDAVYMARESFGKRFLTAHNRKTGDTIWHCPLSSNPKQFSSPLIVGEKYVLHSNGKSTIIVDKKTGNKIKNVSTEDTDIKYFGLLQLPPNSYIILNNIAYYIQEGVLYAVDIITNKMLFEHDFIEELYFEDIFYFDVAKDKSSFKLCITGRDLNLDKGSKRISYFFVNYDCTKNKMTHTVIKSEYEPLSILYKNDLLYLCNPDKITVVKPDDMENPVSTLNLLDLEYEQYDQGCLLVGDTIISLQKGENNTYTKQRFKRQSILNIIKS